MVQAQEMLITPASWGTIIDRWLSFKGKLGTPFRNHPWSLGFPGGSDGKESACHAGDLGLIPGLERSPGGGHGNPLQYSCLEIPHGQRSLVSYCPWGRRESDMTEQLSMTALAASPPCSQTPGLPSVPGLITLCGYCLLATLSLHLTVSSFAAWLWFIFVSGSQHRAWHVVSLAFSLWAWALEPDCLCLIPSLATH